VELLNARGEAAGAVTIPPAPACMPATPEKEGGL